MLDRFFYREKGLFLQSLHPLSALVYIAVLLTLALMFNHPLYLLGLLSITVAAVKAVGGFDAWKAFLKISLGATSVIIIVNVLTVRAGQTVLWGGPHIPVFGRLDVSLEAILFGAVMGLRLLLIMSIFCLYNFMIHPDRVLDLLSRFSSKSGLVLSLAARMFPAVVSRIDGIREALTARGVDFNAGTLKEKMSKYAVLMKILLLTFLEDSMETAEAMYARAFGSGRRSCYVRENLRPRDGACLAASLIALVTAVYGWSKGLGTFGFYPQAGNLIDGRTGIGFLFAVIFLLSFPLLLSWGWHIWPFLKSKI
ncbi:energy-coupling factor transporter transmembrane component T [Thermosediminibacter litoriperuensis]|uniref:Energy-coupling factor transport system permease protein n=1 Tax=Thermosediminibacter litoriperuensis TaxID=291989 RepID=A0A5S5ASL5_9FIRM|nr:energy-coupling factor transporter transmembrane component T [Thermosediminibacter litoriperuensis]TYP54199.1 energy-coupling factor transport system permease protein [Thermosediminibacter litoriperuensis]